MGTSHNSFMTGNQCGQLSYTKISRMTIKFKEISRISRRVFKFQEISRISRSCRHPVKTPLKAVD